MTGCSRCQRAVQHSQCDDRCKANRDIGKQIALRALDVSRVQGCQEVEAVMFAEKNEKIAIDLCARSGKLTQMGQTQACRHQDFLRVLRPIRYSLLDSKRDWCSVRPACDAIIYETQLRSPDHANGAHSQGETGLKQIYCFPDCCKWHPLCPCAISRHDSIIDAVCHGRRVERRSCCGLTAYRRANAFASCAISQVMRRSAVHAESTNILSAHGSCRTGTPQVGRLRLITLHPRRTRRHERCMRRIDYCLRRSRHQSSDHSVVLHTRSR